MGVLDIIKSVTDSVVAPLLLKDAKVYRKTRVPNGRGGASYVASEYSCKALVVEYSDFKRSIDGIPASNRNLLANVSSVPFELSPDDVFLIDGVYWTAANGVLKDGANAMYNFEVTQAPAPIVSVVIVGSISIGEFVFAGVAEQPVDEADATGEFIIPEFVFEGSGRQTHYAALDLLIPEFTFTGTASGDQEATANLIIGEFTFDGTGNQEHNADGAIYIDEFTFSGEADLGEVDGVVGSIIIDEFTFAGVGSQTAQVDGSILIDEFIFDAVAYQTIQPVGDFLVGEFTFAGTAEVTAVGVGSITIDEFTFAGVGASQHDATANITIPEFTFAATAEETAVGTGSFTIPEFTFSGAGNNTAPWLPSDATGVTKFLWYDANDTGNITKDGSNLVSQITDKFGNSHHATQSTAAAKPLWQASNSNFNNKPTIGPIDAGDLMTISGWPEEARFMMDNGTNSVDSYNFDSLATAAVTLPKNVILAFVYPQSLPAAGNDILWENGTLNEFTGGSAAVVPTNAGAVFWCGRIKSTGGSGVGRFIDGPTDTLFNRSAGDRTGDVDMAELVYFEGTVDSTLRQKMEGYLAHKWGLAGSLPGGHPYKSSPP